MSKLTLNVDKTVLGRAKRYAKKRGVSVSQIVQEYLDVVGGAAAQATSSPAKTHVKDDAPVLRIDGAVILKATRIASSDFEDSVTAAAAEKAKCFAIVTRDPAGFRRTGIRALTPEAAAALWPA